jgi:alpha-glucosidase
LQALQATRFARLTIPYQAVPDDQVAPMTNLWWQRGVIYQVYPRSFQDSTGDGVGDLVGIRGRLDHLQWLGVDAVWLSPIFRSPMADFGYDVADYRDVDPLFGTLADLDALIADMHGRGMHLLLDFVPNHTSSQHPWFVDARSSRDAEHRDWYIWRDPLPGGGPPNGWRRHFLGSRWDRDEPTGQYYFHSFLPEQPDLDWTNPAVREAMKDVLRFWFERGIDGFRVDVVNLLAKGPELASPDDHDEHDKWGDEPAVHPLMRELRSVADEFAERVLIGEIYLPPTELVTFYGAALDELHLPFNFGLLELKEWTAATVCNAIVAYESTLPSKAWPNWVLGNHDRPRVATRLGAEQARVATMALLTLRGTPTLYYGDAIGMVDADLPRSAWRDPQGLRGGRTRDGCRTPMVWDSTPLGGFTTGTPWLPIEQPSGVDVASQLEDPASFLTMTHALLQLRRAEPALNVGEWHDLGHAGSAIAYVRTSVAPDGRRFLVCLNLADRPSPIAEKAKSLRGEVLVSTLPGGAGERFEGRDLAPNESLVIRLDLPTAI